MNSTGSNTRTQGAPTAVLSPGLKRSALGAAALWAAGFVIWPGCATPPLPSSRTPAGSIQKADVKFAQRAGSTKQEIIARLGQPDVEFADLNVVCYSLNHLSRHRLWLFLGVLPVGVDEDNPGVEAVLFQFDSHGKLLRHTRRTFRAEYSVFGAGSGSALSLKEHQAELHREAAKWAGGRKKL